MAGRRPRPTQVKKLAGTLRKDRTNTAEPQPESGPMVVPVWLRGDACEAWVELVELLGVEGTNVITKQDRLALALLCDAYRQYHAACREIERDGQMIEQTTKSGRMRVKHPLIPTAENAWVRCMRACVEFGLTPAAKAKTSTLGKEKNNPLEELLKRRAIRQAN